MLLDGRVPALQIMCRQLRTIALEVHHGILLGSPLNTCASQTADDWIGVMRDITVVVTDLDNTLYDWLGVWYRSFKAMLDRLVVDSGVDRNVLEGEIRAVFQRHRTPEYTFVVDELPSLKKRHPGESLASRYQAAIDAYRMARRQALSLYPTVRETLETLRGAGCLVIAFTESMAFYTMRRLKNLGLDDLLDYVYSPPDHPLPEGTDLQLLRSYSADQYVLQHAHHKELGPGLCKPNPTVLRQIINDVGGSAGHTVYIGDNLVKDVLMAQG